MTNERAAELLTTHQLALVLETCANCGDPVTERAGKMKCHTCHTAIRGECALAPSVEQIEAGKVLLKQAAVKRMGVRIE